MACGRRGVTSGDGEGDAFGQLDDAEGVDGLIAGKMPGEWESFLGLQCGPARELAHAGPLSLAHDARWKGLTVRLRGSRVGATVPASVRIVRCSRGYLTCLLTALRYSCTRRLTHAELEL